MMNFAPNPVRAELVEALSFLDTNVPGKGRPFDRLRASGVV